MQSVLNAPINSQTKVFVRCDIDVPIENGKIGETYRLDNLLETLNFIISKGAKPIIAGHIGKPDGKVVETLSTKYLLPYFNENLGEANFELMENLRFDPREEANDPDYAKELACIADIYVNESFATSHRKHASIVGVPEILPHFAGLRLQKEIEALDKVLKSPEKPLVLIVGGVKLESKLPVIDKFLTVADSILLSSLLSASWDKPVPQNVVLASNKTKDALDIDSETITNFKQILLSAKTILWAGPLGKYEEEQYIKGTKEIGEEVARLTQQGTYSVIGGGDTVTAIDKLGLLNKFSFVSTGGGAMLEYLASQTLPGIEALQ